MDNPFTLDAIETKKNLEKDKTLAQEYVQKKQNMEDEIQKMFKVRAFKKDLDELGETYLPDSYVRNLRDRTVAGVAEGTLGFLPDLAYAGVVGVPQYLSVASGLVYNAGARAIDGLLSTLERNVFETSNSTWYVLVFVLRHLN